MRLAQSSSKLKKKHLFGFPRPVCGARTGSKVNYARWSSHSLKVLHGKDKLVVESNPTILKSHLNQDVQVCIINMNYAIIDNREGGGIGNACTYIW